MYRADAKECHARHGDGLHVATLTRMEMNHREFIWNHMQKTRQAPGYKNVYLVESAPPSPESRDEP